MIYTLCTAVKGNTKSETQLPLRRAAKYHDGSQGEVDQRGNEWGSGKLAESETRCHLSGLLIP